MAVSAGQIQIGAPRPWWLILVFVVALVASLVAFAPATLVDWALRSATEGRLYLAEPKGSVWRGEGMLAAGGGTSALRWQVLPAQLAQGRVALEVSVGGAAPGVVARSITGTHLEGIHAALPGGLVAAASPMLAKAALGGTVELNIDKLELAAQRLDGRASMRWMQAGSALSRINPLGDYALEVSGTGSVASAELRTLTGALQVDGQGKWTAGQRFVIDGKARASADAPQLLPFLGLLGKLDGNILPLHFEF